MPLPAIAGALRAAGPLLGRVGGGAGGSVTSNIAAEIFNFQQIAGGIQQLGSAISSLPTAPISAFSSVLSTMQAPITAAAGAMKGFQQSIGAIGLAVSDFVRLASPVSVQRFNLAMDDFGGTLGKIFGPAMEFSTALVRAFADVMFAMSDPFTRLMQAFFQPLMELLPRMANASKPLIDAFAALEPEIMQFIKATGELRVEFLTKAFSSLVTVMEYLVKVAGGLFTVLNNLAEIINTIRSFKIGDSSIGDFIQGIRDSAKDIGSAIFGDKGGNKEGVIVSEFGPNGNAVAGGSVGAAVRPATIGSVEDYGRKAQQAAFSLGTAAQKPEEQTAKATESMASYFLNGKFVSDLKDALKEMIPGNKTFEEARDKANEVADGIGAYARKKFDDLTEFFN
jgi:hypothetical protein